MTLPNARATRLQNFVATMLKHGNSPLNLEWRPCPHPHFPVYEVSEDGRVRRINSRLANPLIKAWENQSGYLCYTLCYDGRKKIITGHRLVCWAWHGPKPDDKDQVAHADGNRQNNHYTNLRWATREEQAEDKRRHQTLMSGERSPRSILNWEIVSEIRAEYAGGHSQVSELARRHGVSEGCIAGIVHNRNWRECNRPRQVA